MTTRYPSTKRLAFCSAPHLRSLRETSDLSSGLTLSIRKQQHGDHQHHNRHFLPATRCFLHKQSFSSVTTSSSIDFGDECEEDEEDDFYVEEEDLTKQRQLEDSDHPNDFLTEFFNRETPASAEVSSEEEEARAGSTRDVGFCVTAPFSPTGDQPEAIRKLLEQLKDDNSPVAVLRGITGTGKTLVMSHVIAGLQKPTLVLCHNKTLAAQLARELRAYLGRNAVELFVSYYNHYVPESFVESTGRYTAKKSSINNNINALRHRATRALLTQRDVVVVATVSCIFGLGLPQEYLNASIEWTQDEILGGDDGDGLFQPLVDMVYRLVVSDSDFEPGTFQHDTLTPESSPCPPKELGSDFKLAKHHKIVLWPPHERFPVTIWANEWQSVPSDGSIVRYQIFSLQQGTAKGMVAIPSLRLFPARHHVVGSDNMDQVCCDIEDELRDRIRELKDEQKPKIADRLQQRVVNDLYMLRGTGFCSGMENYSRHISGRAKGEPPDTLLDYISTLAGNDWLLLMDESHVTMPQLSAMYKGDQSRKHSLVRNGYRLPSALDNRPLRSEEFWKKVRQTLFVSATPGKRELELSEHAEVEPVDMVIRPTHVCDPKIEVRPRKNSVDDLTQEIVQRAKLHERSLAITLTKKDAEDLAGILDKKNVKATYLHSDLTTDERAERLRMLQTGEVDCLVGVNCLREGLDLPQVSLVGVLQSDSEGFLRSDTALLQVVGRAARNIYGTAIFYADRVTDSMKRCIEETNKRRALQIEYNSKHGLEPKSTQGSTMMSLFDLLKDQIEAEQQLEIVAPETKETSLDSGSAEILEGLETLQLSREKPEEKSIETDHIPSSPGVYFWKDKSGKILYIGKAVKLRSRIRSYLSPNAKHSARIKKMIHLANSIDFVLVPGERDALVLESNLIKRHQPPFNVLLKDDEHYPYICASAGDRIPRFSIVPHLPKDEEGIISKHQYFGPFTSFTEINTLLDGIEEKYDLRAKSFLARHDNGSLEEYKDLFQQALSDVFTSKSTSALHKLRSEYEEAGLLFDSKYNKFRDVVAVAPVEGSDTEIVVHVAQLRQGYVTGQFSYSCSTPSGMGSEEEVAEAVQMLLEQKHYSSGREVSDPDLSFFPEEIMLPFDLPDKSSLRNSIRKSRKKAEPKRKGTISIKKRAQRGDRVPVDAKALEFASVNAQQYAVQISVENNNVVATSVDGTASRELAEMLALERPPSRIECYDISHTQGEEAVGSRVVFVDGKPAKQLYRRFNIKTVEGVDDYASLTEVLARRFRRNANSLKDQHGQEDPWQIPDLVLIDGGKGQLSAAMKGITLANPDAAVPICSIAKNQEEIFVPHKKAPVNNSPNSPGLLLLRHLRDESHRFALKNHRTRRTRTNILP